MLEDLTRVVVRTTGWWIRQGAAGGVIAGAVFIAFEVIVAALLRLAPLAPLQMIAAIAIGARALDPDYPVAISGSVGMLVHLLLSAVYGAIFGWAHALRGRRGAIGFLVSGWLYGLVLWLGNFYVVAPVAGWTWFAHSSVVVQVLAHLLFGTVVAMWLVERSANVTRATRVERRRAA